MRRSKKQPLLSASGDPRYQVLHTLSYWLDEIIEIPLIKKKLGLDAVLGLIPVAGDIVGFALGCLLIVLAIQFKLPRHKIMLMFMIALLDFLVGCIPFIGDWFDWMFQSNKINMSILKKHLGKGHSPPFP
jgi:hypothetical protein